MIENKQIRKELKEEHVNTYLNIKDELNRSPFIMIIAKYDPLLGSRALYSSVSINDDQFIRNLLRDALNSKKHYVYLDFNQFYSQVYKLEIGNSNPRLGKQLYAIIILRDAKYPLISILHFKRIGMTFFNIDHDSILSNDIIAFENFFKEVGEIYTRTGV